MLDNIVINSASFGSHLDVATRKFVLFTLLNRARLPLPLYPFHSALSALIDTFSFTLLFSVGADVVLMSTVAVNS